MSTNNPSNWDYTPINKSMKEAFSLGKSGDVSFCCRPMTDRQLRAWNQFFDELITEAKNELARTESSSRAGDEVLINDYPQY
jgi:hypothetical protein